jgi:asparagine synthase (glutamine-hydrolysing)
MISDVSIGAFLSGGVDSSAVVAMMARHSSGPVKTFCIGFDEAEYDERQYAQMVADRYSTEHHAMTVRPDAISVLPRIVWHYGEPFADPSAIPTYYVSEIARKHVTVALNGDGGDESFLGYSRYKQCLQTEWVSRVPRLLRRNAGQMAARIPAQWEKVQNLSHRTQGDEHCRRARFGPLRAVDRVLLRAGQGQWLRRPAGPPSR